MINDIVLVAFLVAVAVLVMSLDRIGHWLLDAHGERIRGHYRDGLSYAARMLKHRAQYRTTNHGVEDREADSRHDDPDQQDKPQSSVVNHGHSVPAQFTTSICPSCRNHTWLGTWCAWCER